MNNIISVFRYEFLRNIRRKAFLFSAFVLPLLIFALFAVVQVLSQDSNAEAQQDLVEDAETFTVGYVDYSGVFSGIGALRGGEIAPFLDEESAISAMDSDIIEGYYIIPEDFADTGVFTMVLPEFSLTDISRGPVNTLLFERLSRETDLSLAQRTVFGSFGDEIQLQRPTLAGEVDADATAPEGEVVSEEDDQEDFWLVYGFAMLIGFSLFATNGYLMQSVIEEKENRIIEILIVSIRPIQLLSGKILALGVIGVVQVGAWLGTVFVLSNLVTSVDSPGIFSFLDDASSQVSIEMLLLVIIYFVLGYLFFAAVFGAIGAISTSLQNGPNYATIFTLPALLLPLLSLNIFVDDPGGTIPVLLSMFPLTSPISMVIRLVVADVPAIQLIISIVILIVTDLGMIWLAGRVFRAQSLLAGQVPKPREIPKLLFSS